MYVGFLRIFYYGLLYRELSHYREFLENQLSDRHTLLKGINELVPMLSIFLGRFD